MDQGKCEIMKERVSDRTRSPNAIYPIIVNDIEVGRGEGGEEGEGGEGQITQYIQHCYQLLV